LEALVWQWEKEEDKEEELLYNKVACNKINKGCRKIAKLCHTIENKNLVKQLPLSWEEVANPSLAGSLSPIISWFAPMHQTNVVASSSLTTSNNTSNNYQNPTIRTVGGRDDTQWNLRQLRSMGIKLARRSSKPLVPLKSSSSSAHKLLEPRLTHSQYARRSM